MCAFCSKNDVRIKINMKIEKINITLTENQARNFGKHDNYMAFTKINEIIDFLNNSQQEEKKEECVACGIHRQSDLTQDRHYCKNHQFYKEIKLEKDQPSKPSTRESIIAELKNIKENFTHGIMADQILDLITKHLLEEVRKLEQQPDRDSKLLYSEELEQIINNIKK